MKCTQESTATKKFIAAYNDLKEKKEFERLFVAVKDLIISAKADGITDKELIDIINSLGFREKFYPAKLKELRQKLLGGNDDDAPPEAETAPAEVGDSGGLGPMALAMSVKV